MSETDDTQIELGDRVKGQIELPTIDITPYIGTETKIDTVTEHKGNFGYYVKFSTIVLDTIGEKDKKIELRASKIIGLNEDAEGKLGWNDDTKMGQFLKKYKLEHYKDAVGMNVICQSNANKEGKEFLTFN